MWWRGQSKSKPRWNLRPEIYRKQYSLGIERSKCHTFKNKARVRYPKCPHKDDKASWLFLMQHYGLPTRLLDWSESPLVALYFAVQENKCDGTLWGLEPATLNKFQIGRDEILTSMDSKVEPLFKSAFSGRENNDTKKILSVFTDQFDLRHMVQLSVFTIHGISTPLDKHSNAKDFLVKIIIPKEAKLYFKTVLDMFMIAESHLFPDLEHLANEVKGIQFEPPK